MKRLKTLSVKCITLVFSSLILVGGCATGGRGGVKSPEAHTQKPEKTVAQQLSDKTWLLAGYNTGNLFVPLEPGQGTTAWILFSQDGSLNGTTGFNTFKGLWSLKKTAKPGVYRISITLRGLTKMAAPNETAAEFEQDLLHQFAASRLLKTGKDSILLMNEQNETLVQCIYREAGLLF
jgi:heat shock protein HslJ